MNTNYNEEWKLIPDYLHYEASSLGRIRMLSHSEKSANRFSEFTRIRRGKILSANKRGNYLAVSVLDHPQSIHRLVCKAFHPNPENKPCVNHKDGNKLNNNADNLEWVTYSENEKHSYAVLGKKIWNKGIKYDNSESQRARKRSYMNKCIDTWNLYNGSNVSMRQVANMQNISSTTAIDRINAVKEVI